MAQVNNYNPNVEYNYQKNPLLDTAARFQSVAGLRIALSDDPTSTRNINFLYPINASTPNPGAGSPTLLAVQSPKPISIDSYAGQQIST